MRCPILVRPYTGERYEASVAPVTGTTARRKGMECVAIALYRQQAGQSPTFNFGRMLAGFSKSSGNNARLVRLGRRFRGGPVTETLPCHAVGIGPVGSLDGDVISDNWCGHEWSPWSPTANIGGALQSDAIGLYRLRHSGANRLV